MFDDFYDVFDYDSNSCMYCGQLNCICSNLEDFLEDDLFCDCSKCNPSSGEESPKSLFDIYGDQDLLSREDSEETNFPDEEEPPTPNYGSSQITKIKRHKKVWK